MVLVSSNSSLVILAIMAFWFKGSSSSGKIEGVIENGRACLISCSFHDITDVIGLWRFANGECRVNAAVVKALATLSQEGDTFCARDLFSQREWRKGGWSCRPGAMLISRGDSRGKAAVVKYLAALAPAGGKLCTSDLFNRSECRKGAQSC